MGFVRIIPDTFEFTYHGLHTSGRPINNVIAVSATNGGWSDPSSPAVVMADVVEAWQQNILSQLTNNYTLVNVTFIDLRTLDGSTGVLAPNGAFPTVGAKAAASAAPNTSYLVHKNGLSARNQRPGRWYLAPISETEVDEDGRLTQAQLDLTDAALLAYFEQVDQTLGANQMFQLATIHVQIPSGIPPEEPTPVLGSSTPITSLTLDPLVATQRRRLRG